MTAVLPSPPTRSRQGSPWHRSSLDHSQSRRIAKTTDGQTTVYVDDGWNVIAEDTTFDIQTFDFLRSYLIVLDLSGSMQGAGGVGGLLSVKIHNSTSSTAYYPCYDGNGNVTEYLDSTGAVIAHFEYDPFGNTVVNTDTARLVNYKFSTKPLDSETRFYYYGYRFYDPLTGRWPSRDPIEEKGGENLYGFVGNNGVNLFDHLGRFPSSGNHNLIECINFSWDILIGTEIFGSNELVRLLKRGGKEAAKAANKRISSVYDVFGQGVEVWFDQMAYSPEITYQVVLFGTYNCKCCCKDDAGKSIKFSDIWSSVDIILPEDINSNNSGEGFGNIYKFKEEKLKPYIEAMTKKLFITNWKKYKEKCGK